MRKYLLIFVLPLLASCPGGTRGENLQRTRDQLHIYRVAIQPSLDHLVAIQEDPELTEKYQKAIEVADAIGVAFDSYLANRDDDNRSDLIEVLRAGLLVAGELVPLLSDDDESVSQSLAVIGLLTVIVETTAIQLEEKELEEDAVLLSEELL